MEKGQKIRKIRARRILDSRANWTVEVDLITEKGLFQASIPSGASKGKWEAVAIEAEKAVENVNKIIGPKLKGKDATKQKEIDEFLLKLDGTENKSSLGANAILAVSMAVCRAGAKAENLPLYEYIRKNSKLKTQSSKLPLPSFNIINGGAHAGNDLDFQEFMICPQFENFSKNLQASSEIYHQLKKVIEEKYGKLATNVGDEGGFAPPIEDPEEAINLILKAAKELNYQNKIKIILDVAASQFFEKGKYKTKFGIFNREEFCDYYLKLIPKYSILALEDPFAEDDWEAWEMGNRKLRNGNCKLIIGDDLLVTNPERIKMAKEKAACNAAIIKINQIGTLSEAIEAVKLAKSFGWKIMVSHRSGETNDDFIADFAVGISADFIKAGAPARGERVAKYNRLLKIEEELRSAAD